MELIGNIRMPNQNLNIDKKKTKLCRKIVLGSTQENKGGTPGGGTPTTNAILPYDGRSHGLSDPNELYYQRPTRYYRIGTDYWMK